MRLLDLTPMLQTNDMAQTIEWYSSVLGFRVIGREGDGWCRLQRDQVSLMFTTNEHLDAPHATATQYIYVDDLLGFWSSIRDRVAVEWGPTRMSYGMMEFAIKDPNGYLLSFGQAAEDIVKLDPKFVDRP